jgi:hypothetical protein
MEAKWYNTLQNMPNGVTLMDIETDKVILRNSSFTNMF